MAVCRLSCSCITVLKKVSAFMHQVRIFSQCQGSISSVSLGVEAILQGMSHVDPGHFQTKEGSSSEAGLEGKTRLLCRRLDLRKNPVLFFLDEQNLPQSNKSIRLVNKFQEETRTETAEEQISCVLNYCGNEKKVVALCSGSCIL